MIEPPYPRGDAPPTTPPEPVVVYTLRDIIDQINAKLDVLTTTFGSRMSDMELRVTTMENRPAPIRDGELRVATLETKMERVETRVDSQERITDQASGATMFREKALSKMVGLASIMGVVAGGTVALIQILV